jgi:hypothetical protein
MTETHLAANNEGNVVAAEKLPETCHDRGTQRRKHAQQWIIGEHAVAIGPWQGRSCVLLLLLLGCDVHCSRQSCWARPWRPALHGRATRAEQASAQPQTLFALGRGQRSNGAIRAPKARRTPSLGDRALLLVFCLSSNRIC